jgi:outer membrane immunogenic protein
MKKVMLGGVALITLGFVGAAVAADMPLKAPPPVVVNTWTGFYVGGDFGAINGTHENESFTQSPGFGGAAPLFAQGYDPTSFNSTNHWGAIGGVYAGYNWAVTPSWVIGVEGDWSKANLGTTNVNPQLRQNGVPVPGAACTTAAGPAGVPTCNGLLMSDNLSWVATVRGRLGYTWGSMMLYGTGGVAFANMEHSGQVVPMFANVGSIAVSQNSNSSGWVGGGGLEVMATANWLVRVEYLHYQFSSGTTLSSACTKCVAGAFSGPGNFTWGSASMDSVRAGLAYKF